MKRGSITLYFSLLAVLFLALFFSLLESARVNGLRADAGRMASAASSSVFAEYNRELLDRYEIFALDTGYGKDSLSIVNAEHRMESYLYKNVEQKNGIARLSFYPLQVEQVQMSGYQLLTDFDGDAYYSMACRYAKDALPIDLVQKGLEYRAGKSQEETEKANSEIRSHSDQAQKFLESGEGTGEEKNPQFSDEDIRKSKEVPEEDKGILEQVKKMQKAGVLGLFVGDASSISQATLPSGSLLSRRSLEQGTAPQEEGIESYGNKVLFQAYLGKKFACWGSPLEDTFLQYEQEYLLAGKNTDPGNLEAVAGMLLAVREGVNFAAILKDQERREEARIIALAITGAFALEGIYAAIFAGVVLAWAFLDSVKDLQTLLGGGEVKAWDSEAAPSLDYQSYLQIFMAAVPEKTLAFRSMDLIEQNVRTAEGSGNLSLDHCIVKTKWAARFFAEPMFLRFIHLAKGPGPYEFLAQGAFAYQ